MARISGVDLPREKRVEIGLTYIYGIGLTSSKRILTEAGVNPDTRCKDLTDDEVEEVRQRVILDTIFKSGEVVDDKGEPITFEPGKQEKESEGNKLLKIANRFIEIDKLSINLIDTVNPFQRAYEVMSKSIDAPTLKIIQNTIAEQKFNLTIEEAITLFKGPLKQYIQEHNGKIPSADDPNPKVRELAAALQMMKNLKERKMRGLDFNPDEFKK